ncbi:uncharacterized protein EKO05_0005620 [Ascochyta rabiei]|uniref:Uncharacterized protein n=1 Tax=Didymella rabiei TaxID=5454 RepID=A0A163FGN8_DIDRA|nr:uncharacterized protein EKO05_0005620 [Ascochyta rabiei]KZM24351.1 hypothetical protein ST47_g4510 [Ascochyta rabiei]UPX15163.1 hypothetical protein EKO05_0005620 [Ascochyta rabiei]
MNTATTPPVYGRSEVRSLFLDFTNSQISPVYARCLANAIETQRGFPRATCDLRNPRPKSRSSMSENTDSNVFSQQTIFAAAEHSPRGFRVDGWILYEKKPHEPCNTLPRKGVFEKRASEPKERKYFPNIIRKDKVQQEMLEKRCNQRYAIHVMKTEREEHVRAEKIEKRNARVRASEEMYERNLERTKRIAGKREGMASVQDVKREIEQTRIQQEIDAMASEK